MDNGGSGKRLYCRNNLALTEDLWVGRIGPLHGSRFGILVDLTKDLLLKEISFHVTGHSKIFEGNHPYLVQSRGGILLVGGKWYW